MNTDGLGTPLEPCNVSKSDNTKNNNTTLEYKPLWTAADHEDPDREDPAPPLTQLGYEDETVKAWRERVDVKMGVGYGKAGKGTPGKGKGKGKDRDGGAAAGGGGEGLGISRRTRLATGR